MFDFSGSIAVGGTPQTVMTAWVSRSYLIVENTSSAPLVVEIGPARAAAVVASGTLSSISVTNPGFNYTYQPQVILVGGGTFRSAGGAVGGGIGGFAPTPGRLATALATISGGSVSSISIVDAGSSYVAAPYVYLLNDPRDPAGCAKPGATTGIMLATQGSSVVFEPSYCPTGAVSIYGGTGGQTYTVKAMP
jgi:hypothetical protein